MIKLSSQGKISRVSLTSRSSRLLDLVDKNTLKKLLNAFSQATGLRANIVDIQGKSIFGISDAQENCRFCQLIWQHQHGVKRCQAAYARAGEEAAKYGEPYIFRCPAGLIEWAAPIIIEGEHLGSIICGQVLMWEPEDFFWFELKSMNKCLDINITSLMEAAKELEIVSGKKVQAAAELLFVTANYIMRAGWESLCHRKEIAHQQAMLADEIISKKNLEAQLNIKNAINLDNCLKKERELISKVKLGDKESSNKILGSLLVDIFVIGVGDLSLIKARIIEVMVELSRSAVENGADLQETLDINAGLVESIVQSTATEDLAIAAFKGLQHYLDCQVKNKHVKNSHVINLVKQYIRENIFLDLSLELIAQSVYLNPSYLSKLFKENQGITVMDYVSMVRIEEAKKLLDDPKFHINDVSSKLGFADPSYFSKVFKRYEGMSPKQFRQKL
ncbi:MAG: PocR ligand-binding domain-containing protein [Dehalobacterium sp.]